MATEKPHRIFRLIVFRAWITLLKYILRALRKEAVISRKPLSFLRIGYDKTNCIFLNDGRTGKSSKPKRFGKLLLISVIPCYVEL